MIGLFISAVTIMFIRNTSNHNANDSLEITMKFFRYYFYAVVLFVISINIFVYETLAITDDPEFVENVFNTNKTFVMSIIGDCTVITTVLLALVASFLHCAYPNNKFIKLLATSILITSVVASSLRISYAP